MRRPPRWQENQFAARNPRSKMTRAQRQWLPSRFALLLTCIPGLGERQMARLLQQWAVTKIPVEQWLTTPADRLQREWGLSAQAASALTAPERPWWQRFARADALVQRHGIQVLTHQHQLYPLAVESFCELPPPVLFAHGQVSLLHEGWRFAVVCSRDAPRLALEAVDEIAQRAIAEGGILVTGHNTAPYRRAATVAIRQERPSITVLDRGLLPALGEGMNRPLFAAARLYELEFRADRDLVLSPFPLEAGCLGVHNQRRDELVFALVDVVFAVWIRTGGVMERLCQRAKELGKRIEVWRAPDGTVSEGVQQLI